MQSTEKSIHMIEVQKSILDELCLNITNITSELKTMDG